MTESGVEVIPAAAALEPTELEAENAATASNAVLMAQTMLDALAQDADGIDPTGITPRGLWTARAIYPLLDELGMAVKRVQARAGQAISVHLAREKATVAVLGATTYDFKAQPGTYVYTNPAGLREALAKQVGKLITQEELDAAVTQIVEPERVIPASTRTVVDGSKMAALVKSRGEVMAKLVEAFRTRDPGTPVLRRRT